MYKILIIDDDRMIGEMLKLMLQFNGYKVFISNKPKDVGSLINQHKIDLILLDQFLFGINGIDICRKLKQNETKREVPILMMSALPEVKKKCLEAGAAGFLSKPFEKNILFSKIGEALKQPCN